MQGQAQPGLPGPNKTKATDDQVSSTNNDIISNPANDWMYPTFQPLKDVQPLNTRPSSDEPGSTGHLLSYGNKLDVPHTENPNEDDPHQQLMNELIVNNALANPGLEQSPDEHHKTSVNRTYSCTTKAVDEHRTMIENVWPQLSDTATREFPAFSKLYNVIKGSALPNFLGAKVPVESGLNIEEWYRMLKHYHDSQLCDFLNYGWPLGYLNTEPPESVEDNHPSAVAHMDHVYEFIKEEIKHKAIIGPFTSDPFIPWVRYSPLMTRPKRDTSKRRIIVDLSYPQGKAVNDGIDNHNHLGCDITYSLPTIADLVTRLQLQRKGAYLWKADLKRAYRQIRTDPLDAPLLGIKVGNDVYIDRCPPFGCRSSAAICQRMANAVVYILAQHSCYTIAYLDDYGGCDATRSQANISYNTFKTVYAKHLASSSQKKNVPRQQHKWSG